MVTHAVDFTRVSKFASTELDLFSARNTWSPSTAPRCGPSPPSATG